MACLIPHRNWESLEKPLVQVASSIPKESMSAAIVKCLIDCVKEKDDNFSFAIYEILNKINLKKKH